MRVVTLLLGSLVFSGAAFAGGAEEGAAPGYGTPAGGGIAWQLLQLDRHFEALEARLAEQFEALHNHLDVLSDNNEPGAPELR